jgi:large subunit ribosomal protein L35
MPKLKTNRSVKKRMRITKSGKIKRFKANKSHLLTGRTGKRKRHLSKAGFVAKGFEDAINKCLPYGA